MASDNVAKSYATETTRILAEVSSSSDKLTAYRNGFLATFRTQQGQQPDPFGTYITRLVYYNLYVQEVIKKITELSSGTGSAIAISTQQALTAAAEANQAAANLVTNENANVEDLRQKMTALLESNNSLQQTISKYNAFFTQSMEHVSDIVKLYPNATLPNDAGGQSL